MVTCRVSISCLICALQTAPAAMRCVSSQASKPAADRSDCRRWASGAAVLAGVGDEDARLRG